MVLRSESNVCVVCERVCEEEGEQTWNAFEETRARSCKGGGGDGSVRDLIGRLEIAEVSLGKGLTRQLNTLAGGGGRRTICSPLPSLWFGWATSGVDLGSRSWGVRQVSNGKLPCPT